MNEALSTEVWEAIDRVRNQFISDHKEWRPVKYKKYMLETWGIFHGKTRIEIRDPVKYAMFLLKWT